jgi:hypothetical protein
MKITSVALPIVVCLLSLPALGGEPAAPASISAPAAGTDLPLTGSLDYSIGRVTGASEYECAITQGGAKWKETISGGSTGCSADHHAIVSKKFKPGKATFGVRAKVNGKWTHPATIEVKLVAAAATPPATPAASGTHSGGDGASGGAPGWPSNVTRGDATTASWNSTYEPPYAPRPTAEWEAAHPNVLRCPHSGSMVGSVEVRDGSVAFTILLDPGTAAPNRMPQGAKLDVTATLANGKITGTAPFKPETLAVLASPTAGYNGALAGQTALTFSGTASNENSHDAIGLHQGRKLKLTVTSGSASCSFEANASDFKERRNAN